MTQLVGISMVKNEADIIEAFVRHNLARLDALVVADDRSVDGTREILRELEREGLPLVVLDKSGIAYAHSRTMSELLLAVAARWPADWIFPLDADEAIDCADRGALLAALDRVPEGSVGALRWKTYVPTLADDARELDPLRRLRHRRVREPRQWHKVIVPRREWQRGPLVLELGNHDVRRVGTGSPLPMVALEGVALAHFPVRSAEQIAGKVACGWLAYISDPDRLPGANVHWREMFRRMSRHGPPGDEELYRLALGYALGEAEGTSEPEPLAATADSALRYLESPAASLFLKVVRTAEEIAVRAGQRGDRAPSTSADRSGWQEARAGGAEAWTTTERDIVGYLVDRLGARRLVCVGCGRMHGPGAREVAAVPSGHSRGTEPGASVAIPIDHVAEGPVRDDGTGPYVLVDLGATDAETSLRATPGPGVATPVAVVLVPPRGDGTPAARVARWERHGWAVALAPTLAVRLLARSRGFRETATVLVHADGPVRATGVSLPPEADRRERPWRRQLDRELARTTGADRRARLTAGSTARGLWGAIARLADRARGGGGNRPTPLDGGPRSGDAPIVPRGR